MKESISYPDLIGYDEMCSLLRQKFNATHDEIRYWVKKSLDHVKSFHLKYEGEEIVELDPIIEETNSYLFPYASDLPYLGMYNYPPDDFFYPLCYFYYRQSVNKFIPSSPLRFIYQKDLASHRNWNDYKPIGTHSLISQTLLKANEYGILRFYDSSLDEFTLYSKPPQIWCHSFEGEAIVSNPDSFYLLFEILTLERVFFNKNRQACLDELEIKNSPLSPNVYNFNKKQPTLKVIK